MPQADSRSTIPNPTLPKALPPATRKIVAAAIRQHMAATEALIAFLDAADGDNELEAEHDGREPEDETDELHDGELDTADDEPLAHPETCGGSFGATG